MQSHLTHPLSLKGLIHAIMLYPMLMHVLSYENTAWSVVLQSYRTEP